MDEDEEDVDEEDEDEDEDDEEGDENDDDDEPMEHVGADLEIIGGDDYDQEDDEDQLDDEPRPLWGNPGGRLGGANAANDIIAVNPDGGQQQGHPWRIAHQYGYRPRDRPG